MAGRIEVAQGYIAIIPSLKGARQKIAAELKPAATSAGKDAGKAIEDALNEGGAKGAKQAGEKVRQEVPKAAETAGKEAGERLSKGMADPARKSADEIASSVQKGLTDRFKGIRDSIKGMASKVGSTYSEAFSDMGKTASGWGITKMFSSYGDALKDVAGQTSGYAAKISGTFRGVAGFVGQSFSGIAGKVGPALSAVGTVATSAFGVVKGAASAAVDFVGKAFKGISSVVGPAFSKVGELVGKSLSTAAKGATAASAAVASAVGAIGKASVDAFSEYEQLSGGARKIFDEVDYSTILSDAQNAYMNLNMSANEYLSSINQVGATFAQTMGDQAGYETAKKGMQAISDYATGTGRSISELNDKYSLITRSTSSYQSIADQFSGILPATSKDFLEQAQAAGLLSESYQELTEVPVAEYQQAVTGMLEKGVQDMGLAGNTAAEAATSIEGSMLAMKSSWQNWLTSLASDDLDVGEMTGNLVQSLENYIGNVVPVAASAVGSVVKELPNLVSTVAPQLGDALVQIVDEATGGMATKALDFVSPITDSLAQAFEGISTWVSEHSEGLSGLWESMSGAGGEGVGAIASVIDTVSSALGGLADGALPIVTAGFDALGGVASAASGFLTHVGDALSPLTSALVPVAEAISGKLCGALSSLGDALGGIDWDGWAQSVSDTLQGVVDFVSGALDSVKGFFSDVASFLSDPIGYMQGAFDSMLEGARNTEHSVASSFDGVAQGVSSGVDVAVGKMGEFNMTPLGDKTASATVTGNAVDGIGKSNLTSTKSATDQLYSKTIDVTANGNAGDGTAAGNIWNLRDQISKLSGKIIDVVTNNITRNTVVATTSAAGHVFERHADGVIVTRPTMTTFGLVGEAGAEAMVSRGRYTGVFPLTNKRYTGPFSNEISDQVVAKLGGAGGATEVNVYLQYDAGADANQMAADIAAQLDLILSARG